jgi:hypothetical protein
MACRMGSSNSKKYKGGVECFYSILEGLICLSGLHLDPLVLHVGQPREPLGQFRALSWGSWALLFEVFAALGTFRAFTAPLWIKNRCLENIINPCMTHTFTVHWWAGASTRPTKINSPSIRLYLFVAQDQFAIAPWCYGREKCRPGGAPGPPLGALGLPLAPHGLPLAPRGLPLEHGVRFWTFRNSERNCVPPSLQPTH